MFAKTKLKLLKSVPRSEPKEIVEKNENYSVAWNQLNERYNNKFQISSSQFRVLMDLPVCSGSVDDLRSVYALQNSDCSIANWNDWLVIVVSQKLDKESRDIWMQQVASVKCFPTWKHLDEFIEGRIEATVCGVSENRTLNRNQSSLRTLNIQLDYLDNLRDE